jgi:transposase
MTKHRNPAYTEAFRKEAVLRSQKSGHTTTSVAKELGVSPQQIYNWRHQFSRLLHCNSSAILVQWETR